MPADDLSLDGLDEVAFEVDELEPDPLEEEGLEEAAALGEPALVALSLGLDVLELLDGVSAD
ncbi:hypothetical protein [Vreelandella titanicae]|uniref:hypothetical protein n=1 Tax=Vreelandella titanicae TaxID=664683 RepID=UPI0021BDA43E|nr:hypothetical protein [Halomonas titanicae]